MTLSRELMERVQEAQERVRVTHALIRASERSGRDCLALPTDVCALAYGGVILHPWACHMDESHVWHVWAVSRASAERMYRVQFGTMPYLTVPGDRV